MIFAFLKYSREWQCLFTVILFGIASFITLQAAEITLTNSPPYWLSLAEVLKKWESSPLDTINQAADKGDLTAQHYLGYCNVEGFRVAKNPSAGINWYQRALESGYLPSANNLGLVYQRGLAGTNDLEKAIYFYRYAANKGLAQAQVNLGILYRDGEGVAQNFAEATKWFRRAADQGHTMAMVEMGRRYRFGQGVPKNISEAIHWFNLTAAKDDPLGLVNLGWIYGYEADAPINQETAFSFYQRAAELGQTDAMYEIFLLYRNKTGVVTNQADAMKWLVKAAEGDNYMAQEKLGYQFEYPHSDGPLWRGVSNMPEAVRWYRRSADQRWSGGQYHLGLGYLEGKGVEQDEERGLELMRSAADQENTGAMFELASLYARGIGEPRNAQEQPIQLLKRITKLIPPNPITGGSEYSYSSIVFRYRHGLGTQRDLVAAAQWYAQATIAGGWEYSLDDKLDPNGAKSFRDGSFTSTPDRSWIHLLIDSEPGERDQFLRVLSIYLKGSLNKTDALTQIGEMYLTGRDVPKDGIKAWAWFTLATQHGAADMPQRISKAEALLTPNELKAAKDSLPGLIHELNSVAVTLGGIAGDHNSNPDGITP